MVPIDVPLQVFRSKKDPSVEYTVTHSQTDTPNEKKHGFKCNCPGWVYRGKCWHVEYVVASIAAKVTGQAPPKLREDW